jgi:hypothetical protein
VRIYDLSGRASLGVVGDERAQASIARHMAPFEAGSTATDGAPDVVLSFDGSERRRFLDVHNVARDGLTTAYDGKVLSVLVGDRVCALHPCADGGSLTLRCDDGFPIGTLLRTIVRPALQAAAVRHDAVPVHSAAVEIDGRGVLVAGWSESGKTETALALMEEGARWLSDKWTLVGADAEASAFPITVGVRRWVLPYLPRLAAALPRTARVQVAVAGAVAAATQPLRRRGSRGGVVGAAGLLAQRAVGVADRAALTQDQVRAAYGQSDDATRRVPMGTLVLLTTVPGEQISVEGTDPAWAAARLAVTGAYERRDWYLLRHRLRYAEASLSHEDGGSAAAAERDVLVRALDRTRVLHVRAPFPVDPRRIAHAVQEAL